MKILIVGAGYVGLELGRELAARGNRVTGWVASPESAKLVADAGMLPICSDLSEEKNWLNVERDWDVIFFCASSSHGGIEGYKKIYQDGLSLALSHLHGRMIYTSSTSVYGQDAGEWVQEDAEAKPASETGKILVEAERNVLTTGGYVARLSGIYGPGRCVHLRMLAEGKAALEGSGERWINQIHRDDILSALILLAKISPTLRTVNVSDDSPVQQRDLYAWTCKHFSLPTPPQIDAPQNRKRGFTSKRISNSLLKSLGWKPKYPSYREGYPAVSPEILAR